jgi:hypothetical protein
MRLARSVKTTRDLDTYPRLMKAKSEGFINYGFILFGCWNNIDCKKDYVYRDIVLDYIRDNEKEIKQLYIAGDNWYPNIRANFKVYLTDILTTGYAKLYAMNKQIHIAVGNHDEDEDEDAKDEYEKDLKKGCNINTQKYYLQQIKNKVLEKTTPPTLELLQTLASRNELGDNHLRNNGVYIYVDDIGVCYNKGNIVIIINTNRFDDYDTGIKYIRSIRAVIMRVELNKHNEQIFVMGHIPLFSYKKDEIKLHKIKKKEIKYDKFILELFNIFAAYNIIYICADTHNFSIMTIERDKKVVIQITAGTGGADPDVLKKEYIKEMKEESGLFNIKAFALNPYGYVTINTVNDNITVCYTQIIKDKQGTSGTSGTSVKPMRFTYTVSVANKTIVYKGSKELSTFIINKVVNTLVKNKICEEAQDLGYITSENRSIACYKKIKGEK